MKKPYRKIPGQPLNKEIFNIRLHPDKLMQKQTAVRNYAQEVPEEAGTIEAEKGETIVGNMNHDGMPMFQKIGGKSHAQGGTILNAPDNAYVFSKFNKMKIKNPYVLQSFGLDPFSAKTPAQISNKYDFSDSVRGLFDPMSDKLQIKTYEMNVKNSINKLGKLALVQEGTKGFPQGVPKISEPYLINTGMSPDLFIGNEPEDFNDQGMPMARRGGQLRRYQKTGQVDSTTVARAKFLAKARGISYDEALTQVKDEKIKGDSTGKKKVVITKAPEKQQKIVKKVPEQSLGFKSGEAAKEFQLKYPTYYTAFLNAYNTGKDIDNTIKLLEDYDVEAEFEKPSTWFSSQGWLPASDQDKFEDLAGQLKEKRDRNKVRKRDNDIANSAETAYNALQRVKNQALINGNTFLAAEIEGKLNKIQKLRPSYKNDPSGWTWYRYEDKRVPVWNSIGETLFNSVEPDKMYNEEEVQFLRNDVLPYMNNLGKSLQGTQPIKKAAPKQTIPVDTSKVEFEYTQEEAKQYGLPWPPEKAYGGNIFKYGGNFSVGLPTYQIEGNVSNQIEGNVSKGKISADVARKIEEDRKRKAAADKNTSQQQSGKAKVNQSQVKNAPLTAKEITYFDDLERDPNLKEHYEKVKSIFFDPNNEDMRNAIYEDYLQRPGVKKRSKEELFDLLWRAQRQVFALGNQPLDHDLWDKPNKYGRKRNSEYLKAMKDIGQTPLNEQEIYDFQSVYHGMQDLSEDDAYKDKFKYFKLTPRSSDVTQVRDGKRVSPADNVFGDTTAKQGIFLADEQKPIKVNKKDKPTDTKIKTKGLEVEETPKGKVGKWWWQDKVQALADLQDRASIKKYYPQTFDPDLYIADPTFYDPNRELAQQASIANLGTRAARKMFDPQRFSSIFSNIQGTAAEQAANTLGRYNNLNVGVANQFAQNTANALGAFSRGLAANRTQNARDLAVLNQQYDNAIRQMRARQTGNYKQAITNMAKTDVLNSLYPQYAIDPETGGTRPEFLRGRVPKPTSSKTAGDIVKEVQEIQGSDANMSFQDALKIWEQINGQTSAKTPRPYNPHQYPESRGWEGSYPTEEEEEDNQSTAYNYDYWDNQQEDEEEYDPYSDYDYEGTA